MVRYRAISTLANAKIVSVPFAYTTEEMEQNTPTGVKHITTETILMEISLTASTTFANGSAFSPSDRQVIPMIIANTSTCSILPSAKAATGLDGIRFVMVSRILVNSVASTLLSAISMVTPCPSPSAFGKNSPSKLANSVVQTLYSTACPPTLPVAETLPIPLIPTISEQNTSG